MRPSDRLLRRGIPKTEIKNRLEEWSDFLLLKYRDPGWTKLTEAMRSYAGTKFRTEVIRDGIEPSNFRWRLELALKDAGWLLIAIPSGR